MRSALLLVTLLLAACATARPRTPSAPLAEPSGLRQVTIMATGME